MKNRYLWTKHLARLNFISCQPGEPFNWIFLPGGPGLGSEVLYPLLNILSLPGTTWLFDLPGDGSNIIPHQRQAIQFWQKAIIEAAATFDHAILVGHSRGGMFALATPELENCLQGIVLLDAAPNMSWKKEFEMKIQEFHIEESLKSEKCYVENPHNRTLREFVLAGAPFMFTEHFLEIGIETLKNLPYNYEAISWTEENFDPFYEAKWVPKKIPALILAGAEDLATPLKFFANEKEFQRPNILLREIEEAGHFPWIENPLGVALAFKDFLGLVLQS